VAGPGTLGRRRVNHTRDCKGVDMSIGDVVSVLDPDTGVVAIGRAVALVDFGGGEVWASIKTTFGVFIGIICEVVNALP